MFALLGGGLFIAALMLLKMWLAPSSWSESTFHIDDSPITIPPQQEQTLTLTGEGLSDDISLWLVPEVDDRLAIRSRLKLWGNPQTILQHNDLLYIGVGGKGLVVVNAQDPLHPKILSSVPLPGQPIKLVMKGNHLYQAAGKAGVQILSLDDPKKPQLLRTIATDTSVSGIAVTDQGLLAISAFKGDVKLYDAFSAPPKPLCTIPSHGGTTRDILFHDDFLLIAKRGDGIIVVDISDPIHPQEIGRTPLEGVPSNLVFSPPWIIASVQKPGYVTKDSCWLERFLLKDNGMLVMIDKTYLPGIPYQLTSQKKSLGVSFGFVGGGFYRLEENGLYQDRLFSSANVRAALPHQSGKGLWLVNGGGELIYVDGGSFPPVLRDVTLKGPLAALPIPLNEGKLILPSKSDIQLLGEDEEENHAENFALPRDLGELQRQKQNIIVSLKEDGDNVKGELIFLHLESDQLRQFSQLTFPFPLTRLASNQRLVLAGDGNFKAAGKNRPEQYHLWIIDSSLEPPLLLAKHPLTAQILGMTCDEDYVYFFTADQQFNIVSLSNPPKTVASLDFSWLQKSVGRMKMPFFKVDHYLFVGDRTNGIRVIDVKEPLKPTLLGSLDPRGAVSEFFLHDQDLFVNVYNRGLLTVPLKDIQTSPLQEIMTWHFRRKVLAKVDDGMGWLWIGMKGFTQDISAFPIPRKIPLKTQSENRLQIILPPLPTAGDYTLRAQRQDQSQELPGMIRVREFN